jgi:hypothetical protein
LSSPPSPLSSSKCLQFRLENGWLRGKLLAFHVDIKLVYMGLISHFYNPEKVVSS